MNEITEDLIQIAAVFGYFAILCIVAYLTIKYSIKFAEREK